MKAPTPKISKDEDSGDLIVEFKLPAIPFVPLDINIVFVGENSENLAQHNNAGVISGSEMIQLKVDHSVVPPGNISVRIRIRYSGDTVFSSYSNLSNQAGKNIFGPF